jgi:hypothetical protein
MACCNWSAARSLSLIVHILLEMVSGFTLRLHRYDSQLVLLESLKVTVVVTLLPI